MLDRVAVALLTAGRLAIQLLSAVEWKRVIFANINVQITGL